MNQGFATLTTQHTKNLGDEIQLLAAARFIGEKSITNVDRERLSEYRGKKVKAILNGWYLHSPEYWPPSDKINPLLTSFHMTDLPSQSTGTNPRKDMTKEGKNLEFLIENAPVGARDIDTYNFLLGKGIPTYFSGCLTLTLKPKGLAKEDFICSVDLSDKLSDYIEGKTSSEIKRFENSALPDSINYARKMEMASNLLENYERAKLVITTRLHAALPSLALGTPVVLINNTNRDAYRFLGLRDLVRNCYEEEFELGLYNELISNPTANMENFKNIALNLEKIVKEFVNGSQKSLNDYEAISAQNLLTVFNAKEQNEKKYHQFIQQIYKTKKSKLRGRILKLLRT